MYINSPLLDSLMPLKSNDSSAWQKSVTRTFHFIFRQIATFDIGIADLNYSTKTFQINSKPSKKKECKSSSW